MTILGAFVIPVALLFFFISPISLLPLLVVVSIFEVGSIFNGAIGSFEFGIAPFHFVAGLIAIRLAQQIWQKGKILPSDSEAIKPLAILLIAFWGWAFCSAFFMPNLFSGMPVYDPREGVDIVFSQLAPLRWTMSNLAQAMYLSLNVCSVLYAMHMARTEKQTKKIETAFLWAAGIAVGAGLIQRIGPWLGWSYPYEIFANNPVYFVGGNDQEINGQQRVNSTFAEASMAGAFLSAAALGLLASYLSGRRSIWRLLGLILVIMTLIATISTTGFVSFAVTGLALLIYFNPLAKNGLKSRLSTGWLAIISLLGIGALVVALNPSFFQAALSVTAEKGETTSYVNRLMSDLYGLLLFKNTWGIGVGLGSNRPSSLISGLLSTLGAVGTGLFALILFKIFKMFPGKVAPSAMQMAFWALIGMLVGGAVGVSDLNHPSLWGLFIVLVTQLNRYSAKCSAMDKIAARSRLHLYGSLQGGPGGLAPAD